MNSVGFVADGCCFLFREWNIESRVHRLRRVIPSGKLCPVSLSVNEKNELAMNIPAIYYSITSRPVTRRNATRASENEVLGQQHTLTDRRLEISSTARMQIRPRF